MMTAMNRAMNRITKGNSRLKVFITLTMCVLTLLAANWARAQEKATALLETAAGQVPKEFHFFAFMTSSDYSQMEKYALWAVLCVAFAGLGYALMLVGQVKNADQGTPKMQKVAAAIRAGAEAYLGQQFRKIVVLIVILTVVLFLTALSEPMPVAVGRAVAFLIGSLFSFTVGFVGMRFATLGNLRVAAAARTSFGGRCRSGTAPGRLPGC